MRPIQVSDHARRQCEARGIAVETVADIVAERVEPVEAACAPWAPASWAVLVGYCEGGGFRGASNGDVVWAVLRGATLATVMYRRGDQPSRPEAFGVERVVA